MSATATEMRETAHDDRAMRARFHELIAFDKPFGVLAFGVDNFDRINNLFSYEFGDRVLEGIIAKMKEIAPAGAETFRFDGDCFGTVVPSVVDAEDLQALFERLIVCTTAGFIIDGAAISFKVTGCACLYPSNGSDAEELFRNLHIALIDAKRSGRGSCTTCTDALCIASRKTLLLMETLQGCIADDYKGFSVLYQPFVDARTGEVHGCEALMRWQDEQFPEGVKPFEFIPYLEESGLISTVTVWLMETTFEQAARWVKRDPSFIMNINLSKYVFDDPDFKFSILQAAKKHHVDPRNIMLELTESGMITDAVGLGDTFDFLRSQGFGVAFDDFGTGYASLNLFRVIAADELKIDRTFLERITYDVNDQRIVSHIIDLSHSMNLRVCVEGVETEEVLAIVQSMGADLIQGFFYERPIDAETFERQYLQGEVRIDESQGTDARSIVYAHAQPVQPLSPGTLIDRAHAGVFQVAMDENFTFITCNEGYRRMLGYTTAEIETKLGNRALAIVHPDDMAYVNEEIRRQLGQGDTVLIEFRIVRADGRPLWITGTGNVVRPKIGVPYLVVVIMDTDRFKRETLKSAEELKLMRHILDNAPIAIKCLSYDEYFTIKHLSGMFLSTIGYTPDEIRDRFDNRYINLVHPDDIAPAVATVQKEARPGHVFDLCYRLRASDGRMLWLNTKTKLCEPDENGVSDFVSVVMEVEGPNALSEGLLLDNRYQMASKRWGDVLFNLYLDTHKVEFTDNYEDELGAPPCATIDEQLMLSPESDRNLISTSIEQAASGFVPAPIETRIAPRGDQNYIWCSLSFNCAETSDGNPVTIFGRLKNIDAEKRERDELLHDSQTDPLCDVLNKITVEDVVEEMLRAASPDAHYSFAIIDIDNFKSINDTAGHLMGDQMLVTMATTLKSLVSEQGVVGRIGGDEFMVFQPCDLDPQKQLAFGQSIIDKLARVGTFDDEAVCLRTSVGLACYPEDGTNFYELFKHADAALYLAKERGKNRVCVYRE